MANYLLVYHGGKAAETPEAQATVMQAWTDWFGRLGPALVDGGTPASQSRAIGSDGTAGPVNGDAVSGYSILKADSIDRAVDLARGCPILVDGAARIEVVETLDLM